jgi:hypothetical protein
MFHALSSINVVPVAQRIKAIWLTRVLLPRQGECIDDTVHLDYSSSKARQLDVHETYVEFCIVNDDTRVPYEGEKVVDDTGENRFIPKNGGGVAMHTGGIFGDLSFGINQRVKGLAGGNTMNDLDRSYFEDAMSVCRVKTRGFCIHHNFTHGGYCAPRLLQRRA